MGRWRPRPLILVALLAAAPATDARATPPDPGPGVDYEQQVRPLLKARCVKCHGPDRQRSGLRVDRRASLLHGGDSGEPSVVPGDGANSPLVQAVAGEHAFLEMPPSGGPLATAEVALLRDWIDQGAEMPEGAAVDAGPSVVAHWSLQPLRPVRPPAIDDPWVANPIDAFVLARMRAEGLTPSPPADPHTLVRRVTLVMHGLPPDPEELERLVPDAGRPGVNAQAAIPEPAYRRWVDQVLDSPRYGERWAQHWLDVIRWAETWGFETNSARLDAWPYRDWVIRALNDDLPYDRFILEQLAGDTVGEDAATGLLVAGPANLPGQIGKDEESRRQARQDELDEVVKTVGAAFLGLTVGCARCHNHKFDPITQRDYYALQAVFSGLHYGSRRMRGPEDDRWTAEAGQLARELEGLRTGFESRRQSLGLRPAIDPGYHVDRFGPVEARAVRMTIHATQDGGRASLFELEVWGGEGSGAMNVALAANGGTATASSFALENQTRHPENLIDGLTAADDRFPWIAREAGPAWVRVDLARPTTIDRVAWRRGSGTFPADYDIEVQQPEGAWIAVAHPRDRMLHEEDRRAAEDVRLAGTSPEDVAELVAGIAKLRAVDAEYRRLSAGPQVFAGTFGEAEPTYLLLRGDPMQRREIVTPDVPAVLGSLDLLPDADEAARRVALARHLASPDIPLVARVLVNRIWQHHFGTGLVETPSDFGRMGAPPSHPELLDWLAVELIQHGWSIKHIQRRILTSRTFRQASTPREGPLAVDADSRLLWRFPPRRLDAEAIRDSILHTSGTLNPERFGPGFDFFNQRGGLSDYIPKETFDEPGRRRMIYATRIRMQAVDIFGAFDCPDAGQMTPRRTRSITPIQALNLWNSAFVNRQAGLLAERVRAEAGPDRNDQVARAMTRVLGRPPTVEEARRLTELAARHGLEQACRVLLNTNEFLFLQ